jgi:hypothetical protein
VKITLVENQKFVAIDKRNPISCDGSEALVVGYYLGRFSAPKGPSVVFNHAFLCQPFEGFCAIVTTVILINNEFREPKV